MKYKTVEGLIEIRFFVYETDQELAVEKLKKIGIPPSALAFKSFPPSPYIKPQWIVNVNQSKSEVCVNCVHVNNSHQKGIGIDNDKCYGLDKEGNVCNCIKFIPVEK